MFIEFGDCIISTSCIAAFKQEYYYSYYYIIAMFNRKIKDAWDCREKFETEEEMLKRWDDIKKQLTPQKVGIVLNSGENCGW